MNIDNETLTMEDRLIILKALRNITLEGSSSYFYEKLLESPMTLEKLLNTLSL